MDKSDMWNLIEYIEDFHKHLTKDRDLGDDDPWVQRTEIFKEIVLSEIEDI